MARNFLQEQLSSLYDRIADTVGGDLDSFQQELTIFNPTEQETQSDAELKIEQSGADLLEAQSLVDDIAVQNARQRFTSNSQISRAIQRNIQNKRNIISRLDQAADIDTPDSFEGSYFNPLTGQRESVLHQFSLNEKDYESDVLDDMADKLFGDQEGFRKLVSDSDAFNVQDANQNQKVQKSVEQFFRDQQTRLAEGREEIADSEIEARRDAARSFMTTFNEQQMAAVEKARTTQGAAAQEQKQELRQSINKDQQDLTRLGRIRGSRKAVRVQSDVEDDRPM